MDRLEGAKRLFLDAMALQEQGDLERAEALYKKALDLAPGRPSVMNNLAAVYIGLNRYADARLLCERLLELNPEDETALVNLGNCQLKLGSPADALLFSEKALRLKPGYAEALNCRGSALLELKRPQEALESCERALALKPDYVESLSNRGNILMALDRPEEALASYERALILAPNHAEALYNLGTSLHELNRLPEALAAYDRALAARPDYAEALNNRATTLLALKRVDEALASWNRALEVKPDYPEALYNRGDSLMQLNRPNEALASYERALILRPDYAAALNNRANTLMLLRRYQEATQDLERLLAVVPEYAYAAGQLVHCKMHMCEWDGLEQQIANLGVRIKSGKRASTPFPSLAASASAAEQLQCARTFALHKHPLSSRPVWNGERYRHERIRVGYVSGEFREHATSYLVAELFELHDRSRFEVFGVSTEAPDQSPMARRVARACEHFLDVSAQPDRAVASLLRNHEIDILLDLNGYFGRARTNVFAARAAPVQVNYLGFPGTMGAEYMDYIIADRHVIPEDQRHYFTEHVVYLPDSYQANDSKRKISEETPTRAAAGLPERGIVYCCFNNNHKILPGTFDIWMRLLGRIEGSVLWLLQGNPAVSDNIRREAQRRGVAPERIVFAPRVKLEDHLARHRLADLFLDTLPHNAHTTASDALWAGLPVLTRMGTTFAGRVAGSLLNAVGLPELITQTAEDYEALALKLAADAPLLADIKAKLARNRTVFPLFDTDRFRRHIEAAFVTMWERSQRGEPAAGFAVSPL